MSSRDPEDLRYTLYQHGLSVTVLFDLLVQKGILTREEIRHHARLVTQRLMDDGENNNNAPDA